MEEWKDTELFVAVKEGDKDALSVLFLRYYDYLKHYGIRVVSSDILVEECIQEMFLYLFEAHSRLGNVRQVKAYLFSSLRRRLIEKVQRERTLKNRETSDSYFPDIQFSIEDIRIETDNQREIQMALSRALNQLPWRQKEAIYLRYYNGLRTKEIAEIMEVTNQTILNTLHQAIKKIRKDDQLKGLFGIISSLFLLIS